MVDSVILTHRHLEDLSRLSYNSNVITDFYYHFCDVLVTYKGIPPLYIGLFSRQIWPDLREVRNWREKGRNPPIGGKKYTLFKLRAKRLPKLKVNSFL